MRILRDVTISRSTFIRGAAGSLALAAASGPWTGLRAIAADVENNDESHVLPPPRPISGGLDVSPLNPPFIHAHEPGTAGKTLPYTGALLEGLDTEPNTITDFRGVIAQAYHVGTATGSDGNRYNMETDIRAYQGEYVAQDGSHHKGTFALL